MIEKFKTILNELNAKGQIPVAVFAFLKMDDVEDRWTIVFADESASLTDEEKNTRFNRLLIEIRKFLDPNELSQIARVAVFSINEHLIQSLLHYQTGAKLVNEKVNGNFVHEGYIIKSAESGSQDDKNSLPSDDASNANGQTTKGS
jgi:hypothetical protein